MNLDGIIYPGLVVCMLLAIMLIMAVGSSYLWLRHVDGSYRKCPSCGKAGAGYVLETNLLNSQTHVDHKGRAPARVTKETFEDLYECEHCKHQWKVKFQKTDRKDLKKSRIGGN